MGISSVNNNVAFAGNANKNDAIKKPSKVKVAAGVAVAAGAVALGAGLATGRVKPADITTFLQKAGSSILEVVKHPRKTVNELPSKLWGLTVDGVGNATTAVLKAKDFVTNSVNSVLEYAKIIAESFACAFGKK